MSGQSKRDPFLKQKKFEAHNFFNRIWGFMLETLNLRVHKVKISPPSSPGLWAAASSPHRHPRWPQLSRERPRKAPSAWWNHSQQPCNHIWFLRQKQFMQDSLNWCYGMDWAITESLTTNVRSTKRDKKARGQSKWNPLKFLMSLIQLRIFIILTCIAFQSGGGSLGWTCWRANGSLWRRKDQRTLDTEIQYQVTILQ